MIMRKWKEAASRSSSKIKISLAELTKLRSACEVRSGEGEEREEKGGERREGGERRR